MRSMLYAFDGTWNDDSDPATWTNVYRLATCAHREHVRYYAGVGSWRDAQGSLGRRLTGGAFAKGLGRIVNQAVADWRRDRAHGVAIIDVIGFSRGAIAALTFANRIREQEDRDDVKAANRCRLRFLGCFDTVDAIGLPDVDWDPTYAKAPPRRDGFAHAVHAVALHETRATFQVVDVPGMDAVVGFFGGHSDVGGGLAGRGLSDQSLMWMYDQAAAAGRIWDRDLTHLDPRPDPTSTPYRIRGTYAHQPRRWPRGMTLFPYPGSDATLAGLRAGRFPHFPLLKRVTDHRPLGRGKQPVPQQSGERWIFVE